MQTLRLFLLAVLLPLLSCSASALAAPAEQVDLAPSIEYLEDAGGKLTLDDVTGAAAARFRPWRGTDDFNLGYSAAAVWLRVSLARGEGSAERLVELAYLIDEASFYAPGRPPLTTGLAYPAGSRAWPHRFFVFPVTLSDTPHYHYLRVRTQGAMTLPLTLWEPAAFALQSQLTYLGLALYFGGLLALLLYNFLLFVSLRERAFLVYTLFVGCMGAAQVVGNGIAQQFFGAPGGAWSGMLTPALFVLTAAAGTWFTQVFLQTRARLPRLHRALGTSTALFLLLAFVLLFDVPVPGISTATALIAILSAVLVIAAGVVALRAGDRSARFFLLAWGVLWIGGIVANLRNLGWLPSNLLTGYAITISSAIEMLLLSFALGERIRFERDARETAQADALAARQSLVEGLRDSESRLEKTVEERTAALSESLYKQHELALRYVRFGALIAHEFRNPLAIIKSQLELIGIEKERGIDNAAQRIASVVGAAKRLERLFEEWLRSDRLREKMHRTMLSVVDLPAWLSEAVAECCGYHPHAVIEWAPPPGLPRVIGDAALLRIALRNLIDNAVKYAPAGTPITVTTEVCGERVGLAVTDRGPDIPAERRDAIFLEYVRGRHADSINGLGLGLAFVKRVAELHQGEIELTSATGGGNRFCLWLPLAASEEKTHE